MAQVMLEDAVNLKLCNPSAAYGCQRLRYNPKKKPSHLWSFFCSQLIIKLEYLYSGAGIAVCNPTYVLLHILRPLAYRCKIQCPTRRFLTAVRRNQKQWQSHQKFIGFNLAGLTFTLNEPAPADDLDREKIDLTLFCPN